MWAVEACDADIIALPLGFAKRYDSIDQALQKAWSLEKIVFAATSNAGLNSEVTYPASDSNVIAISATDGYGNISDFSPAPFPHGDNFATLGVEIKSKWQGETVYKSGTSFATVVAAGIAGSFLEYARWKIELPPEWICSTKGMRSIFRLMSRTRGGFNYVAPWILFDGRDDQDITAAIMDRVGSRL